MIWPILLFLAGSHDFDGRAYNLLSENCTYLATAPGKSTKQISGPAEGFSARCQMADRRLKCTVISAGKDVRTGTRAREIFFHPVINEEQGIVMFSEDFLNQITLDFASNRFVWTQASLTCEEVW